MSAVVFFFYLFSTILLASAFMVIAARNPVHAVLFLILAFFNAAGLFVLMGAEFLAMLLVVVYVGAVAVLFLFVVMMLDVDFVELRQGFLKYLPIGGMVAFIFGIELVLVLGTWKLTPEMIETGKAAAKAPIEAMNIRALGRVLYTENFYFFQLAGLVLLVAMIGAIVLTLRSRTGVKRQDVMTQNARTKATAMDIKKVAPGQGV
ncbi:MAG: NADH-quinone oxidoreductase subunit J [Proteobacteria bacterium]|nr:NADH-quinone oxidoreductase subunit J [Pseudomonadota bacterium]